MSYYDDRRSTTRDRRRDDGYYDEPTVYNTRDNQRSTAMVRRRSDDSYDEEIKREFSPNGGYYRETTIRKSGIRPAGRARSYEQDRYDDDRSFASSKRDPYYAAAGRRGHDDNRRSRYQSEYSSRSPSPRPKKERRKSMPEEALEAIGLGGLVATLTGKKNRSRSRSSSSGRGSRSRRGRSSSPDHRKEQLQQALKAAVLAGAASAWRARHEDGGWNGEKGKRVLTAALTAGGVDGFINRDKDPEKHQLRDTIGAAVAGVATDRLVNGPRSRSRGRRDGSYSPEGGRSRSRSKIRDLAAGGAIAAAAKKMADSVRGRSKSRGRERSRDSYDSYDSRSPPRARSRSRSVIARGLSRVGLGSAADRVDPAGARERSRSRGDTSRRRSRSRGYDRYADDNYVDGPRSGGSIYDPPNYNNQPGYIYETKPHHNGDPETDSDSDLGSSTDDEQLNNKSRKRLLVSGGLATVATIHAGKSVHDSMEKRQRRKRALKEGTISKEEAQQHKTRDHMQEAASIGLAALGLKGAYSEWKEVKGQMDEDKEQKEKNIRHARKRSARRAKYRMVGMADGDFTNSAPTLSDPFYGGNGDGHYHPGNQGPYMSGANGGPSPLSGGYGASNVPHYFDDNPYGSMAYQQGYQGNTYGTGTGFPPPPMGQPPPPQGRQ
ncbi:hypothetical protein LTS08_002128 [Lithohypha guttulata]|nr:hypothetical protein LTS08_002128 [Lithohypha guttulata]